MHIVVQCNVLIRNCFTFRGRSWLALETEGGSESGAVIKTPALLDLGRTRCISADLSSGRTSVCNRRLPAFNALSTWACHSYPVLKTQFLTKRGKSERIREWKKEQHFPLCHEPWQWPSKNSMKYKKCGGQVIY